MPRALAQSPPEDYQLIGKQSRIAYAVIAWLLMQIATQVFPFLEIPNWAVRLVIMLLALGFPGALILAWAFELTPEGIKLTESADREAARGDTTAGRD